MVLQSDFNLLNGTYINVFMGSESTKRKRLPFLWVASYLYSVVINGCVYSYLNNSGANSDK
jgi:hypothetical protein